MKRIASFIALAALTAAMCQGGATKWRPLDQARNVIVLIPDGCPPELVTLARLYRAGALRLDPYLGGMVRTRSADSLVTDSAAAGTALACGAKTDIGLVGVSPREDDARREDAMALAPMPNLVEAARASGRAVGLVVTSNLNDATPAAFSAHSASRKSGQELMEQMVHQGLDVALGGGWSWMIPTDQGGRRTDGQNLFDSLAGDGACVVTNVPGLAEASSTPLWGFFARDRLSPSIDRVGSSAEPTLAMMTRKAIDLLKTSGDGFFLMVEGSQVDWACHANDTAWALSEFFEFDAACGEALRFAAGEGRGSTLVIVCPDHATGGLTLGCEYRGSKALPPQNIRTQLAGIRRSSYAIGQELGKDREPSHVAAQMRAWWGLTLGDDAMAELTRLLELGMNTGYAISEIGWRFGTPDIGWTSHDHTGGDVPLWSYGPGRPTGCIDNTEVAAAAAKALGVDLAKLGAELYVDLDEAFPGEVSLEPAEGSPRAARVRGVVLPFNRRMALTEPRPPVPPNGRSSETGGRTSVSAADESVTLDGLVIHIEETGKTYAPKSAIAIIERTK